MNIEKYDNIINPKKYKNINFLYSKSSINRYNKYNLTKKIDLSDKIITIFKVENANSIINYAYLYTNKQLKHKYININNTLRSKDGIYSYGFIKYKYIKELNELSNIIKFIKQNSKILKFSCYTFNTTKKNILKIESSISNKFYYKLLAISFIDSMNSLDESRIFSKKMLSNFKNNNNNNYDSERLLYFSKFDNNINIVIGQKIIPESLYAFSYDNYKIIDYMQEIDIMQRLNQLIFNMVTPCFALLINNFLYKEIDTILYDNAEITNKINISKYLSKKDNLKDKSSNVLFLLVEHCGYTLFNHIINNEYTNIGNIINNNDYLKNFLFQIIYTLYSLNKINIIHNDLHLNNITMHIKNEKIEKNMYSLYNINNNSYKIEFKGSYPVIVDFGRSIQKNDLEIQDYKFLYSKISTKKILTNSKQKLFNAYCAIDIFKLSTSLKILLDKLSLDEKYIINKKNLELLENISNTSYKHLYSVFTNKELKKNINISLLDQYFSDLLYNNENCNIVDIFSISNIT